ncbi:TPA: ABC transporter permease [bacterium]|nr:ABC transporter permease [bacterium]
MKKSYLIRTMVILTTISLFVGVSDISIQDLINIDKDAWNLLYISRIPRVISVIVTGVGMSICGLIMQQIGRNKFVSPSTAATMDSAKLGFLISMIFFTSLNNIGRMLISFVFSLIGTFLFMFLLRKIKFKNVIFVPLIGILLGNLIDSITTFFAYRHNLLQALNSYMVGDFSLVIKGRYELLFLTIPLVILAYIYANKFTIAGMGEDFSKNLGLNYKRVVSIGLIIVSLVTAAILVTIGSVPFLGLIVPNIVSIYKGDNVRKTIWETAIFGANFLLICDIISRVVIYPYVISIGLTVGVVGSLIFLALLLRRVKLEN